MRPRSGVVAVEATSPATIVTFYSYTGGVGRTMAVANVAWILAGAGKKVLVVDWSTESPALHGYLAPFLIDDALRLPDHLADRFGAAVPYVPPVRRNVRRRDEDPDGSVMGTRYGLPGARG